jgi:chromosome segregation ATPase
LAKVVSKTWVPLKLAAEQLGENVETTRLRLVHRQLKGEKRGRRWFVEPQALAKEVAERGGTRSPLARIDSLEANVGALAAEVERLGVEFAELRDRPNDPTLELEVLRRERDRYRAEASTLREAAIRANAGQRSIAAGFRKVLDAVDENADALTELLGPRDVSDLLESRELDYLVENAKAFWGG